MLSKVENFLRSFSSCLQLARIYGSGHPKFDQSLIQVYQNLKEAIADKNELALAIIDKELASGDDIFFDLSRQLTDLINKLLSKKIEKVIFKKDIQIQELKVLFLFLLLSAEDSISPEDYLRSEAVVNIETGKIRGSDSRGARKYGEGQNSFLETYLKSVASLPGSLESLVESGPIDLVNFSFIIENLAKGVDNHYQEILRLSKLKSKDSVTFAHLLNVSFLAICFSKSLGFDDSVSRQIGLSGLFHDLGKLYISGKLLRQKKIAKEEFEKIKSHSLLGAEILLNYVDRLGQLAPVVALEHHLRFDAKGYPKLRFRRRLHLGSMLIAICDVYDALSQRRSYKNDYPPERIYQIMKAGRGSQFHPGLFDAFFRFMGVWPNGTIVALDNGEVAVVQSQNPDSIYSPKVKVISGLSSEFIDLKKQSNLRIKKSLNPNQEGKKYSDLL